MTERQPAFAVRLWRAVFERAIEDWMCGTRPQKRGAERYLFNESSDFRLVCRSAGIDADRLRAQIARLGRRAAEDDCAVAA
jgi:hypothetical protein